MNFVSTARTLPGLPAVRLSPEQRRQRNVASARLGATSTRVGGTRSGASPVMGQPSMRLLKRDGGGVVTELRRRSAWTDFLSEADLAPMERIAQEVLRDARSMSRGGLSTRQLARMGHPYGRGARRGLGRLQGGRRGISNLAIANRQTGELERGWSVGLERGKAGVTLRLSNDTEQAGFLAFGTARMRAHGPASTAVAKHLPAINRAWATATRKAQARVSELERMAGGEV